MSGEPREPARSLAERRHGVLERLGLLDKHRITASAASPEFHAILVIVVVFIVLGLIMVLSSSSVTSLHSGESAWYLFRRQTAWAVAGAVAMWAVYQVPYHNWRRANWLGPPLVIVAMLNLIVPFVGREINGARAWLQWGFFRLQPSEFMKILTIMACAHVLSLRHRYVAVKERVLYPLLGVLGVTGGLCIMQRDYGTALIFGLIVIVLMLIIGIPWGQFAVALAGLAVAGTAVLMRADTASRRLFAFLNLDDAETRKHVGYQVYQSILSIANGGLEGTGLGSGTSKWGYVPLAYSDFIFAVIAEELGVIGALAVILGFLALAVLGVRVALAAHNMHGALLAGGVTAWLSFQSFVNIGGIIGVIPMTGLTLPFMSYGGSSLMATMIGAGLLLNVARNPRDRP